LCCFSDELFAEDKFGDSRPSAFVFAIKFRPFSALLVVPAEGLFLLVVLVEPDGNEPFLTNFVADLDLPELGVLKVGFVEYLPE
jgi:hypothetical protein